MLIGLIDPSHDEYKAAEAGRQPDWFTVDDLLTASANASPKWSPYPYEVIAAMIGEHQERDYISTTMVASGCARSAVLERKEEYIESLARYYAAFRGTMLHAILEKAARPGALAEVRFHTTVEGIPFSCSPDLVTADGAMYDYKVTENPPTFDYPWKGHTRQLQYNRFVVNNAEKWEQDGEAFDIPFNPRELDFTSLSIVYLGPKGPKTIMSTKSIQHKTPNNKTVKRRVPRIDTDEQVFEEMWPRINSMQLALDSYPEWPAGLEFEEGWGGPPGWACPGKPWCHLPDCLGKRYPHGLTWGEPKSLREAA